MIARALAVRLPEGVEFSLPLAGPVRRLLALLVDVAAVSVASSVLSIGAVALAVLSVDLAVAVTTLLYFVLSVGYGIACEGWLRGQTLGKRLLGLRVMDARGLRLTPAQVVLRNLLRPIDSLPALYLIGGIAALLSPRGQRLGDLAAGTVVVRVGGVEWSGAGAWSGDRFNSLAAYPHLVARLRQSVTPDEARLALEALERRDELRPEARVELFAELAAHLRERVRFPEEAWSGLPDERYVRAVVDLLFRPAIDPRHRRERGTLP